jgi:phosphomannomutase/phosphoglucomutase
MAEGEHHAFMRRLLAKQHRFSGAQLTTLDGLRADFEDGWGLVRASNTTPGLTLRFEAQDAQAMQRIQGEFRALLLGIEPNLHLPF